MRIDLQQSRKPCSIASPQNEQKKKILRDNKGHNNETLQLNGLFKYCVDE